MRLDGDNVIDSDITVATPITPTTTLESKPTARLNTSIGTNANTETKTTNNQGYTKQGTVFELQVINLLKTYGINAQRTGGAGDRGVDFVGSWNLWTNSGESTNGSQINNTVDGKENFLSIPIIGQCKSGKNPVGPKVVREFEG